MLQASKESIDKDGLKSCVYRGRFVLVIEFMDGGSINIMPVNSIRDPIHDLESNMMIWVTFKLNIIASIEPKSSPFHILQLKSLYSP